MTTQIEIEQKYEASGELRLPPLEGLPQVATVGATEDETLSAEYFDTDDLRLLRAGVTVRRRRGGPDEGWHLKLPLHTQNGGGPVSRQEIRLPLARRGRPVPDELTRLIVVHTRQEPLRPVAQIETRRHRTVLRDAAGASLAEVVADEVAAQSMGASTTVSLWNEVEVELTGGSRELLRAADKRLRGSGLRPAGRAAKLERVLSTSPPPSPTAATPGPGSSAGEVVLGYIAAQAARLKSLDPAVRKDEPDAVHQMRVTARRLRSALQEFPMLISADATWLLRDELKRLGKVLGDARDAEVLSGQLRSDLAQTPMEQVIGPAQARIQRHFAAREAAGRDAVLRALDSAAYFTLLDELDRLLDEPPLLPAAACPARQILPKAVGRSFRRTRRRMRRATRSPEGTARDTALHEARKAAKRTRYAAEAVRPACGTKAARLASRMKAVQSVLGDHQDAVNARAVAREIGMSAYQAGENAFSFGVLYERARRDASDDQKQARRTWKRATRGTAARWPK
jgi:CHAD domain-containing protein